MRELIQFVTQSKPAASSSITFIYIYLFSILFLCFFFCICYLLFVFYGHLKCCFFHYDIVPFIASPARNYYLKSETSMACWAMAAKHNTLCSNFCQISIKNFLVFCWILCVWKMCGILTNFFFFFFVFLMSTMGYNFCLSLFYLYIKRHYIIYKT